MQFSPGEGDPPGGERDADSRESPDRLWNWTGVSTVAESGLRNGFDWSGRSNTGGDWKRVAARAGAGLLRGAAAGCPQDAVNRERVGPKGGKRGGFVLVSAGTRISRAPRRGKYADNILGISQRFPPALEWHSLLLGRARCADCLSPTGSFPVDLSEVSHGDRR